jgi:hypothetical protein
LYLYVLTEEVCVLCVISGSDNWQCSSRGHGEIHRMRRQRGADETADEDEAHGSDRSPHAPAIAAAAAITTITTSTTTTTTTLSN